MKKRIFFLILPIIPIISVCMYTYIFLNIYKNHSKNELVVWQQYCSLLSNNRQTLKTEINPILKEQISTDEKINKIKNYIYNFYKKNNIQINNINIIIENLSDEYIVNINYDINKCNKNDVLAIVIPKEEVL